jgi:hypothetical protein
MKRCGCLALAVLALAACGGAHARLSRSEYQAKLQSAFSAAQAELGSKPGTSGSVESLKRIGKAYDDVAVALKGLKVPTSVQALNDRLAAAAAARAAALKALTQRLEAASPTDRKRLLAEYDTSTHDDFDALVQSLASRGYRFKPSEGT